MVWETEAALELRTGWLAKEDEPEDSAGVLLVIKAALSLVLAALSSPGALETGVGDGPHAVRTVMITKISRTLKIRFMITTSSQLVLVKYNVLR